MTDKEKILAKIESLLNETNYETYTDDVFGRIQSLKELKSYIDTMQKEPASDELEDAAIEYCSGNKGSDARVRAGFLMGANWQKEQLLRNAFEFTESHNIACVLASECLRGNCWFNKERDFNDLFRYLSCVDELFEGKFSGKTKVIAINED